MSLKTKIEQDIKTAMKAKDQGALRALRAVKSAILIAETSEGRNGKPLSEDEEMKILMKQAKQRKDSIQNFEENNREDLAAVEKEELVVIESYLPRAMTPEELKQAVASIVESVGASSMKDMGKVMGIASKKLAGKADGKAISQIVKEILS
ncbi:MAG: GatB/YqeY domain-containing protein [Bacteroidetes bacterium]|nr:GatB/YqeY domain-containing protein [Bacteroidota bacterium]MCB0845235.1 GatB/YqeY domain-containing protein [Bacteroidota bacterium]MCB0853696.1 GatB/YqeY domain-containing protein [Bacteroidota bacterium]